MPRVFQISAMFPKAAQDMHVPSHEALTLTSLVSFVIKPVNVTQPNPQAPSRAAKNAHQTNLDNFEKKKNCQGLRAMHLNQGLMSFEISNEAPTPEDELQASDNNAGRGG